MTLNDLLNDNIINKSELVIKRHEYLGLDDVQASFLAKIFINNNESYSKVDIDELSKLMSVDIETVQAILKPLITSGMLGIINEDNKTFFNLDQFINKLLNSYSTPGDNDHPDAKVKWILNRLTFILTDDNISELRRMIDYYDWNIILKVIEKMGNQSDQNFPLLVSLLNVATTKKEENESQIKSILDVNWLED